jgi:RHS repeat-associated protein
MNNWHFRLYIIIFLLRVTSSDTYAATDKPEFVVLARSGMLGIQSIHNEISVNDYGNVAFIALLQDNQSGSTYQNLFIANATKRTLKNISPSVRISEFIPGIEINNQNAVLVRRKITDRTSGVTIVTTYLDLWDANTTGAYWDLEVANLYPVTEFDGIYSYPSINNNGRYFFVGFRGASKYVAARPANLNPGQYTSDLARPIMADNDTVIIRLGNNPNYSIQIRSTPGLPPVATLASSAIGFSAVGLSPGISDDGQVAVFYGNLTATNWATTYGTHTGPGIFAFLRNGNRTIRVAGLDSDGGFDGIRGFFPDEPVCVNNGGTIAFVAANPDGRRALFRTHLNLESASPFVAFPEEVATVGSEIEGVPGILQNLYLYGGLNNAGDGGQLVFWSDLGAGNHAVLMAPRAPCQSCRCEPGDLQCDNSSLGVKMGLGRTTTSTRSAYLKIYSQAPTATLATPGGLTVSANGSFARLYATNLFSTSNVLRQVKGASILADIIPNTPYGYTVRFYNEFGSRDPVTGLYPPVGSPISNIDVENPDGATSTNRLRLTRNGSEVNTFTYDPASGAWELLSGVANALRKESLLHETIGVMRIETRTVKDVADAILSQTVNTYQTFPWGEELIKTVANPSGLAKTTTYTYYTNQPADGANYSKLRSVLYPEGRWDYYREYSGDVATKQVAQFLNNFYAESPDWPDPDNRCSETIYSGGLETHLEYLKGQTITKRWHNQVSASEVWDCVATTPATTNWNDSANLITRSFTYTTSDAKGASVGQTAKVINPDGTISQYFYYSESIDDPYYVGTNTPPKLQTIRTVTVTGQPNTNQTAVIDGTRSEQVQDALGNQVSRRDYDVATGLLIGSETTTTRDWLGRATRIDYLDGTYITRIYDCCGLARETDREGITTIYSTGGSVVLDLAQSGTPQTYAGSSVTRAGLTTYTLTDALGRATHTVLQGTNGALIIQEQRGYDSQGNLAWSRDAMNRLTTYTNTTDGPFRVAITTFPDGSQSIESTYQDGSAYETRGNAVQGLRNSVEIRQDNGVWVQATTQTRLEKDGTLSPEYTTTYTDFAGRNYKTEYPWPDGGTNVFALREYNPRGQLAKSTDPDGLVTLYAYNGRGELETTALDLANPGVMDFGGTDRITRTTSSVENSAQRGMVVRKTVTDLWETNGSPQSTVLQVSETSADGTQTWSTQWGLTTHTTTAMDRANQRRTVTTQNPDGTTAVTIFEQGRQKSVTRLDKNGARVTQTTFAYDPFGRLQTQTDARNGPTSYTYYDDGQLHTVTTPDPDPGASGPGLDPQTTSYVHYRDPANGITTVTTLPDGGVVTQEFFPNGQPKKTWGARTYPAEYTYDRAGRMETLTTWQQFDFGTGTGISGSATTRWNYNARGLLANKRYADNKGPGYSYTAGGKLKTRLWARGVLTTYGYDDKTGDLLTTSYSDATPAVTNTYARNGQLKSLLDASGLRTFGYHHGLTATEAYGPGLFAGFTLVRDYDDLDRQSALSVTSPTGTVYHVTYGYDAASRLYAVTSGVDVATYAYHPDSDLVHTLTQSHSNAVRLTTTKLFDKLGRLRSITSVPSADNPISFAYQYNDANQRTRATLANGEYWTYGYDPLGQVTNGVKRFPNGAPIPGYSFGYDFDEIGNRISASREAKTDAYTNNALNQIAAIDYARWLHVLGTASNNATITVNGQTPVRSNGYFYAQMPATSVWNAVTIQAILPGGATNGADAVAEETGHLFRATNAVTLQYDEDGNLLSDGHWSMTWDAENRVIQKESLPTVPQAAQRMLEYALDSWGRRVLVKVSERDSGVWRLTSSSRYLANRYETLAEIEAAANTPGTSYIWGVDLTGTRGGGAGLGGLLLLEPKPAQPAATQISAFDGNGNNCALISAASGCLSAQYEYDPFGCALRLNGSAVSFNSFRFSTKFVEAATGDLHHEFRDYHPGRGRWMSLDPIGELGGINPYAFAGNDLVNHWDILGLWVYSGSIVFPDVVVSAVESEEQRRIAYVDQVWQESSLRLLDRVTYVLRKNNDLLNSLSWRFSTMDDKNHNKFVYTCKYGWIDMGHFFNSAWGAYDIGFDPTYFVGHSIEVAQRLAEIPEHWWDAFIKWRYPKVYTRHDWSAYTPEDLTSDWEGDRCGFKLSRADGPVVGTRNHARPWRAADLASVGAAWKDFLRGAGAVGEGSSEVRKVLEEDVKSYDFQFRPHDKETAIRWQQGREAHKCLCSEVNPNVPKDLYLWPARRNR